MSSNKLEFFYPELPPSSNNIYTTDWYHKRRRLSDEAEEYKAAFKNYFHHNVLVKILSADSLVDNVSFYELELVLNLKTLINKGWPKKAKTRVKKMDGSNRIKLLEDSLAFAMGIDDSQFATTIVRKNPDPDNIGVTIRVTKLDWDGTPEQGQNNGQKKVEKARSLGKVLRRPKKRRN